MGKRLVCLNVPSISEQFDMFVPDDVSVKDLIVMITGGISDLSSGRYGLSGYEMLMQKNPGRLLKPENTLSDYDIGNGAELVLF